MSSRILNFTKLTFCVLACGVVFSAAKAQESLFIARVERITLEPRGGQYCPDLCAENGRRNPDGSTYVCISNDGGCDRTEYSVSKVLVGDIPVGPNKLNSRIGEWGGTHFPISNQPILVHMKPGFIEWVAVVEKNGRHLAKVKAFRHGILDSGVDLRKLAQDGDDGVPVETLIERFSSPVPPGHSLR